MEKKAMLIYDVINHSPLVLASFRGELLAMTPEDDGTAPDESTLLDVHIVTGTVEEREDGSRLIRLEEVFDND